MNFYIIRLSFNNLKQKKLSKKEFSGTKIILVEKLLQENYEYTRKSVQGYVDFHLGNFKTKKDEQVGNFYFATLGTYKVVENKKFDEKKKNIIKNQVFLLLGLVF